MKMKKIKFERFNHVKNRNQVIQEPRKVNDSNKFTLIVSIFNFMK